MEYLRNTICFSVHLFSVLLDTENYIAPQQNPATTTTVRISRLGRMIRSMFLEVLLTLVVGLAATALAVHMIFVVIAPNMLVASYLLLSTLILLFLAVSLPCSGAYGFYTAIKQKLQEFEMYSLFVLATMFASLTTGGVTCLMTYTSNDAKNSPLNEAIISYHINPTVKSRFDVIQSSFRCCGVKYAEDWNSNALFTCKPWNSNSERCSVPQSCCLQNKSETLNNTMLKNCGVNALNLSQSEKQEIITVKGCQETIDDLLHSSTMRLLFMFIILAMCQFWFFRRSKNIIDVYVKVREERLYTPVSYRELEARMPDE